jgi:transcriptional regulator with XRE-family HTH domain
VPIRLQHLERERVRRGLSRRELATAADIAYTYLTELETGKRLAGDSVTRRLIAALAAVPVAVDLVGASPERGPSLKRATGVRTTGRKTKTAAATTPAAAVEATGGTSTDAPLTG